MFLHHDRFLRDSLIKLLPLVVIEEIALLKLLFILMVCYF